MTRVLVFSTAYLPHVGGAEIAIREIAERLKGTHSFELVCARFEAKLPSKEVLGAVTVHRLGIGVRILDKLLLPFLAAAFALSRRYDLYWAMMVTYGTMGAYLARPFTRTPIVLTLQEGDPPEYLRRKWFGLVAASWRHALHHSAGVTAISSYLAQLARVFGYSGELSIVPNGVDTQQFSAAPPVPHEGTVLITTSRLVHKNAVDVVLRALTLLPDTVTFLVYGTGPDEAKLKALAEELKVEGRVRFMGQAPYEELPAKLAEADIFIRPSRSEGMGNSFIEAMAAGLPVIATQEGGIRDFLFDSKLDVGRDPTGYAVPKDSPEEVARAVRRVLEDPALCARVVENARTLVRARYTWDAVALGMRRAFERVAG